MIELVKTIVQENLKSFPITEGSEQRSVGDLIEFKVTQILLTMASNPLVKKCLKARGKKSIEDVTVVDKNGIYHYVDTKTHNEHSEFSMPNLTSIDKIRKMIFDEKKTLSYVFVHYSVDNNIVTIKDVDVKYLWEVDLTDTRIGALGKGQLQISNMKKELHFTDKGKTNWFEDLKKLVRKYHDDRIAAIEKEKLLWL